MEKGKRPRRRARTLKASDEEWAEIKKKAEVHSKGNVSAWIKRSAREYEPAGDQ